jgi:hypothetical protein
MAFSRASASSNYLPMPGSMTANTLASTALEGRNEDGKQGRWGIGENDEVWTALRLFPRKWAPRWWIFRVNWFHISPKRVVSLGKMSAKSHSELMSWMTNGVGPARGFHLASAFCIPVPQSGHSALHSQSNLNFFRAQQISAQNCLLALELRSISEIPSIPNWLSTIEQSFSRTIN